MALALYRKYRPATFAEAVGQEHVTEPLMQALSSGRINHAYLFSGPRGCGKTTSARILARSLNCETRGPTPDPCGKCDSCVALAPDGPGSLDVIENQPSVKLRWAFEDLGSSPQESVRIDNIQASAIVVPEPGTIALLGLGGLALVAISRRRRQ